MDRTNRSRRRRPAARAIPPARRGAPGFLIREFLVPRRPLSASSAPPLPLPGVQGAFRRWVPPRERFARALLSQVPLTVGSGVQSARDARLAGSSCSFLSDSASDKRKAATGAFGLSPSAQRPTRFCEPACARSLDLPSRAGCSPELGGPRAAHRLLQSSRPASTPCELSEPDGHVLAKRQPTGDASLRRDGQPGCPESGVARQLLAVSTPARRPLAAQIYPDSLRSEHPHVARLTPPAAGNPLTAAIYGSDPSEEDQLALANQAEAWPRPKPWLAFRAAVPPVHANGTMVDCTQGAFRLPILVVARRGALSARGGGSAERVSP